LLERSERERERLREERDRHEKDMEAVRRPRSGRPAFSTLGYRVRARGGLAESPGRPTGRARGGRLPGHVDEHVDVLPLETCTRCGGAVGTEQVEVQSQPPGGSKGTAAAAVSVAPPPKPSLMLGPSELSTGR